MRSASEVNPRTGRRRSLVRKLKGYFNTGEKELTEEQKEELRQKEKERYERKINKVRDTAYTKLYKYTARMDKLYKKMLQKLQETMEDMKNCSSEWQKEKEELQSWGVSPLILKTREKLSALRRHIRQLALHVQTKECDIVSTHNEAARALIKKIGSAQSMSFANSLDQQLVEPQSLFENNIKLTRLKENLLEVQEEFKYHEKEYNTQLAPGVKQVKKKKEKKAMIESYLGMMEMREAMLPKHQRKNVEKKYQCYGITKGSQSFQALLYDVRIPEGKILADKLSEFEALVEDDKAPTCDDLVEFTASFVEMVTRNYQISNPDSERRLSALCESVLYPRLHPFIQHALGVESSETVERFVEHRVWLRRLHPLHFAIDPKYLPKELRVHDDTGTSAKGKPEADSDARQLRWQRAMVGMYVESRKALAIFAVIHSNAKGNLPPRVLTAIMRVVHCIHVEAKGYCSDAVHAEDFFPLLVWCCVHCDDAIATELPRSVLFSQKFAIDAGSVPRKVVAEVCYYFTSMLGAVQWIGSLVEGSEAYLRLEKQRRKNILNTRCGSILRTLTGGSNVDTLFGDSRMADLPVSPIGRDKSRSYTDQLD